MKVSGILNIIISVLQAEDKLRPIAFSPQKHENILKDYGIVYMKEPILFRKGTTLVRKLVPNPADGKLHPVVFPICCDITTDEFWKENPEVLALKIAQLPKPSGISTFPVKRQMNEINSDVNTKVNQKQFGGTQLNIPNKTQADSNVKLFDRRMSGNMLPIKKN